MLDTRRLRAAGLRLDAPGTGSYTWTDGTRAELDFSPPRLTVTIRLWEGFAKGYVPVTFEVQTDTTPCHYGRTRTWLLCPVCGRRRIALAVNHQEHKLSCRVCAGLSYKTQSMTRQARIERRVLQLVDRLGLDEPDRPSRMRQKMYARLSQRYLQLSTALFELE